MDNKHRGHGPIRHDPYDCAVCRMSDWFNRAQNNLHSLLGFARVLWDQWRVRRRKDG